MQLKRSQLSVLEDAIHKTGIPYEDVKIELVDHLATVIEHKIEYNPKLSFEEALSNASISVKESIIAIRHSIRMNTIQSMIKNVWSFSSLKDISLIVFFGSIALMIFLQEGIDYEAIMISYMMIPFLTLCLLTFRIWRIRPGHNFRLHVLKKYAWLPIIFAAGAGLLISTITVEIMDSIWYFKNALYIIPSITYGFLMKTVADTLIFNIHDLRDHIEVHEMFLPELV